MRIVDRNTFLTLPPKTLYSLYDLCETGCIEGLNVKYETVDNDWYFTNLLNDIKYRESREWMEIFQKAEESSDFSFSLDLAGSDRDGFFVESQKFVIWEQDDILQLFHIIKELIPPQ